MAFRVFRPLLMTRGLFTLPTTGMIVDRKTKILDVLPHGQKYGFGKETRGKRMADVLTHPIVAQHIESAFKLGPGEERVDQIVVHAPSGPTTMQLVSTPIFGLRGRIRGLSVVLRDVHAQVAETQKSRALVDQMREVTKMQSAERRIRDALIREKNPSENFETLVRGIHKHLKVSAAFFAPASSQSYEAVAHAGHDAGTLNGMTLDMSRQSLTRHVLETGGFTYLTPSQIKAGRLIQHPKFLEAGEHVAGIPVFVEQGKVGGVLLVSMTEPPSHQLKQTLQRIGEHASELMMLEHLARVSRVTGLPNRWAFEERLRDRLESYKRGLAAKARDHEKPEPSPFALVSIDLNGFGNVNNSVSHPAGDLVLEEVGKMLREGVKRKTDFVGQWAGDEFVLILDGATREEAHKKAEELRTRMIRETASGELYRRVIDRVIAGDAKLDIDALRKLRKMTEDPAGIGFSFGITDVREHPAEATAEEIYSMADARERTAKDESRASDQVEITRMKRERH